VREILATAKVATLPDISIGHSLLQMGIALTVVVAAIWGLSKVLARLRGGAAATAKRRTTPGGLSIVSRQSLGKDLAIATVRWGEREVLVGIAGSTITFLDDGERGRAAHRPQAGLGGIDLRDDAMGDDLENALRATTPRAPRPRPGQQLPEQSRQHSLIDALRDATARR
jgi:flagellar biogenesis protein FliO